MKYMHMKLEVLTPVHVGSGETMDPTSYVIMEDPEGPALYTLDLMAWIEDHPDPPGLAMRFSGGNLPAIRGFLRDGIDAAIYSRGRCLVVSRQVYQKYEEELANPESRHRLNFSKHLRNSQTQALIIPGSSLKGAMRTAVIDYLDREKGLGLRRKTVKGRQKHDNVLQEALGNIGENAFRLLKVGDFEAPLDTSLIVSAVEVGRNDAKKATPKDPCEAAASRLLEPLGGSRLYGRLALGGFVGKQRVDRLEITKPGYASRWGWDDLAKLVSEFYRKRFDEELQKFYTMAGREETRQALEQAAGEIRERRSGEMLLRVGHYSHVECMTVTDNAPRGRNGKYGTTRTLAHGVYPFGWVKLVPCSEKEYRRGLEEKAAHDQAIIQTRQERRREQIRKKEDRVLANLRREEEEKRRQEEEKRLQEELDSLSPDERDLRLLQEGKLNENQVYELYRRLDDMEPDMQRRTARAVKELWQGRKKKWKKKECSPKQYLKVQYIKKILGEA